MIRAIFLPHAAAAIITTVLTGLVFVSVQQSYRTGADDPQIQIAQDVAHKLQQGKALAEATGSDTVNLEQSLGIFVQVYSDSGKLASSTGFIGTQPTTVPVGVLAQARALGEYAVTWQPYDNVRLASVLVYPAAGSSPWKGFVLAGRSLLEIEKRETNLQTMVLLCWLVCMGILCMHALLQGWLAKGEETKRNRMSRPATDIQP